MPISSSFEQKLLQDLKYAEIAVYGHASNKYRDT